MTWEGHDQCQTPLALLAACEALQGNLTDRRSGFKVVVSSSSEESGGGWDRCLFCISSPPKGGSPHRTCLRQSLIYSSQMGLIVWLLSLFQCFYRSAT